MRIAMVHSSFAVRGGAERYIRDLSGDLESRGHDVRVFCRGSTHREPGDHVVATRLSARIPAPRGFAMVRKVATHVGDLADPTGLAPRDLADFRPDLVHVHNWQGLGVLPIARLARRYPTCHTVHDYAICDPNNALLHWQRVKPLRWLLRLRAAWLIRRLRFVTLLWPTGRTRDIVRSRVPGSSRLSSRVVPLAVRTPVRQWPAGRPGVFLYLGALSPHKGTRMLLEAWRCVAGEVEAMLLIAGDGPLRGEVEAAARDCSSIRYLGYLDEPAKARAMAEAGWLVFPSQCPETFGISCAEALVAGRPIIADERCRPAMASDTSVVTFHGREELSEMLRWAARMPRARYHEMSVSACADGRRLDWDAHVAEIVRTYETLATEPLTRRRTP
jgi:glycosyltransferase involved in cell wall biosynthesis